MSDHRIALIPEDPRFMPDESSQQAAIDLFAEFAPDAEEIESKASDGIQFFDCGQNLEHIFCPFCRAELDPDWWQEKMDGDFVAGGFQLGELRLPCCGAVTTLNGLRYDWPQGFARFALDAMNPNIGELSDQQIEEFQAILKTPLRVIYQHI